MLTVRAAATQVVAQILRQQGSLSSLLPVVQKTLPEQDRALLQELCFGVCRFYPQLQIYVAQLLDKPLRAKDKDVEIIIWLGLYQLCHMRIPNHAAIAETVEVTRTIKKPWATGLVNGVLRQFIRDRERIEPLARQQPEFTSNHPQWLEGMLRKAWGNAADKVMAANNAHPPFTIRINPQRVAREDYLAMLKDAGMPGQATAHSEYGITLERACDPRSLPLFGEGVVSVQDEAAQLAADLMALEPNLRVLDACAAPGGKTGHLLEREPSLHVTALDADERRLQRVRDNLARLNVAAEVRCGDGTQPADWWDGQAFDRILLDAPCSATGIVRRHPDIKLLRTPEDITKLSRLQAQLLDSLWPLLRPGGRLVYATCSVMPRENTRIIEAFVARQSDARNDPIAADWGISQPCGRQLLPQADRHDGFYYAVLSKALA